MNDMRLKLVDYNAMRAAFDEKFKETMRLIQEGETHLDNLAEGFHEANGVIWSMPNIDAVEVVRCKDCKHFLEKGGILEPWCDWHEASLFGGDGFCADGERKDGDG